MIVLNREFGLCLLLCMIVLTESLVCILLYISLEGVSERQIRSKRDNLGVISHNTPLNQML